MINLVIFFLWKQLTPTYAEVIDDRNNKRYTLEDYQLPNCKRCSAIVNMNISCACVHLKTDN